MLDLPFSPSSTHSLGIELELQLIDLDTTELSDKALEIIKEYNDDVHVKKELTLSTIEINSSVHTEPFTLYEEMSRTTRGVAEIAKQKNCGLCGGGRHISNIWKDQLITPTERYTEVHQHIGFLAKLSCVFGQHIHVGVRTGDDAIYLCHALIPYLPHFITLSASSPYYQSEDTLFASSRFSARNSFHTFGVIEHDIRRWQDFVSYIDECTELDVIRSLKDIYWEVRPKPDFGTIEIRTCDTPLTIFHAAMLGGYAQMLVKYLLNNKNERVRARESIIFANTFNAQRYGFDAPYIDADQHQRISIKTHIRQTLTELEKEADDTERKVLSYIADYISQGINDADEIRNRVQQGMSESDIIRAMMDMLVPTEHITHSTKTIIQK